MVADEAARALGASGVVLYRVNREQTALVPLPAVGSPPRGRQLVAGTLAGRAFTSSGILSAPGDTPGRRRVFVPLLDGTDQDALFQPSKDSVARRVYGAHYLDLANKYFGFGRNDDARRCYLAAIRLRPVYLSDLGIARRLGATVLGRGMYDRTKALLGRG